MKRYYPFSQYLKNRFGERVHKIAIDAGLTCPNLDGTKGVGGCTYCNNAGFSFNSRIAPRPIAEQVEQGLVFMKKRFRARRFMAYFQAHTNTYAPVPQLKTLYDQIPPYPEIVALSVATRPDSVSPSTLSLLESYIGRFQEVWVEYGLQSAHNQTLERVNRQDTWERFLWVIDETSRRPLKTCVHVILGLPGETHDMMMETAERLAPLPFHSIKIHLLHILKDTPMEQEYYAGNIPIFERDEYVRTVCDFLEHLPSNLSIQRLTADAPPNILVAPAWCLDRQAIYEGIDQELERRGSCQGFCVNENERLDDSRRAQNQQPAPTQA